MIYVTIWGGKTIGHQIFLVQPGNKPKKKCNSEC